MDKRLYRNGNETGHMRGSYWRNHLSTLLVYQYRPETANLNAKKRAEISGPLFLLTQESTYVTKY